MYYFISHTLFLNTPFHYKQSSIARFAIVAKNGLFWLNIVTSSKLICDVMQTQGTGIVTSYSLIVLACKGDLHKWITTVNIDFSPPGIHGLVCRKYSLDMIQSSLTACHQPRTPFLRLLWAHNPNLVEIHIPVPLKSNNPISLQFCTWNDSSTAMPCMNLCSNWIFEIKLQQREFHKISIISKWIPVSWYHTLINIDTTWLISQRLSIPYKGENKIKDGNVLTVLGNINMCLPAFYASPLRQNNWGSLNLSPQMTRIYWSQITNSIAAGELAMLLAKASATTVLTYFPHDTPV